MKEEIKKKTVRGFGVVGTWLNEKRDLGGILPIYLSDKKLQAKQAASEMERHKDFIERTDFYLCEIIIKPLKKVKYVEKTFKGVEKVLNLNK